MTTGASPSILGLQRSRKPPPTSTEVPSVPAVVAIAAAEDQPVFEEQPGDLPTIKLDPASAYGPTQIPQAYGQQPPMRLSPQLDPYHPYGPYSMGERVAAHQHFSPYDPYYMRADSPYSTAGLAPPPQPFMRPQSPSGPYMGPQRLGAGLVQGDFGSLDSNSSDQVASDYSDAASRFSGSRLQTPPFPRPPLPPKPIELTGILPSAISELPHPTTLNPSAAAGNPPPSFHEPQPPLETRQVPSTVSPIDKAPEPPKPLALFHPDETCEPSTSVPQDEIQEPPAASPKPARGMGGRPTTKALELIEQGFTQITAIIEELAQTTGKPPSDLYRRLEKSRKGSSDSHLWNIYLHYFARHEEEEAARIGRPLQRTQTYRSQCYARYKADNENFQELLEAYHELEMATAEMTVGQRKREAEKYEKKLRDIVS